jgi:methionyl-tRNA formyltransferase
MRIIFFGTPEYVLPILNLLHKSFKTKSKESPIVAVVTQKPKTAGRKKIPTYSVVDKWAYNKKIPVFYGCQKLIKKAVTADIGILAAYHEFIPSLLLNYFAHGILNIHPSLLPKYRSSSPVQAAIISGDLETGVTIIKLDDKLDHGPIVSQFKEGILPVDTTETLRNRLFAKSAEVLVTLIPAYLQGKITMRGQNHKKATHANMIKKEDAFIPPKYLKLTLEGKSLKGKWKIPFIKDFAIHPTPTTIHNFIRAMQPWPVAWTKVKLGSEQVTKRLKILKAHTEKSSAINHQPSIIKLVLDEVQLEGKNPVTWKQFKQGYPKATFL